MMPSLRAALLPPNDAVDVDPANAARVVTQAQLGASKALLATDPVARAAVTAYLALGANLGEAQATVRWAMAAIAALPSCALGACSSLYRTAPVDSSGPDYINAVVEVSTSLCAPDLLAQLHGLEQQAGRVMRVFPGKEMGIIHCPRDSMHAALNRVTGSTLNYWRRSGHKITTKHYDDENAPLMLTP